MSQNRYLQFSTRTVFCSYETMNFQVPNFEISANKKSWRYDVIQKYPVHCHLGPLKTKFQQIFLPKKVAMPSKKLEVRAEALRPGSVIHGGFSGFKGGFFPQKTMTFGTSWDSTPAFQFLLRVTVTRSNFPVEWPFFLSPVVKWGV